MANPWAGEVGPSEAKMSSLEKGELYSRNEKGHVKG